MIFSLKKFSEAHEKHQSKIYIIIILTKWLLLSNQLMLMTVLRVCAHRKWQMYHHKYVDIFMMVLVLWVLSDNTLLWLQYPILLLWTYMSLLHPLPQAVATKHFNFTTMNCTECQRDTGEQVCMMRLS